MHTFFIFDWNGTVMDDVDRAVQATNAALKHCGIGPLDKVGFQRSFTLPLRDWFSALGVPEEHLGTTVARWNEGMRNPAPMRDGAAALIHHMNSRGVILGVVTAADQESLEFDINAAQLQSSFAFVRSSVTDKEECLRNLKIESGRYIYVGDTAYDVHCARSAGFEAAAISGGYQSEARLRQAVPDYFAHDFKDLVDIVTS